MIQIKHNKLRIPTGGRLTSWLFAKRGGVEIEATKDKSIQWKGGGFELGTSGLQVHRPTTGSRSLISQYFSFARQFVSQFSVANDWSKSYLTDRQQVVMVNNTTSRKCNTTRGVPQGSVLGPFLFLLLYK